MTPVPAPAPPTLSGGALQPRFLTVISHELRTPLTTIASFTESLDTDDLAPDERSLALQAVRRNTDRMLTLVEDLMVVSGVRNSCDTTARKRASRTPGCGERDGLPDSRVT